LVFLAIVIGGALLLFALRAPSVGLGERFDVVSRESLLLANNVILAAAAASVLLGTLYPLLIDAMGMGKISVGPPYFDAVFVAIMAPGIFLMGLGPIARWKKATLPDLATKLRWAFVVSLVSAILVPNIMGKFTLMIFVGLLMAFWVLSSVFTAFQIRLTQASAHAKLLDKLTSITPAFYGMLLAHLGLAVFVIGVTMVKGYKSEQDVRVEPGQTLKIDGMDFRFDGAKAEMGPNYESMKGTFYISKNGQEVTTLYPEKRFYPVQGSVMTEASISPGLIRDLYISLGEQLEAGAWSVRIYIKPFVQWIWAGAILMALGGILALIDKRYRSKGKASHQEVRDAV
jgi:cytochrome c-type biogenesis protein CcmF